jgi:hypothetical protein
MPSTYYWWQGKRWATKAQSIEGDAELEADAQCSTHAIEGDGAADVAARLRLRFPGTGHNGTEMVTNGPFAPDRWRFPRTSDFTSSDCFLSTEWVWGKHFISSLQNMLVVLPSPGFYHLNKSPGFYIWIAKCAPSEDFWLPSSCAPCILKQLNNYIYKFQKIMNKFIKVLVM